MGWENSGGPIPVGGPSGGQRLRGTCRSEGLSFREHVPDGLGQLAGDLDPSDLLAPLTSEAGGGGPVVVGIGAMAGGVGSGLDQGPAQVSGSVLGQGTAAVPAAGLIHPGAQAGVAAQVLGEAKRAMSPISAAMV